MGDDTRISLLDRGMDKDDAISYQAIINQDKRSFHGQLDQLETKPDKEQKLDVNLLEDISRFLIGNDTQVVLETFALGHMCETPGADYGNDYDDNYGRRRRSADWYGNYGDDGSESVGSDYGATDCSLSHIQKQENKELKEAIEILQDTDRHKTIIILTNQVFDNELPDDFDKQQNDFISMLEETFGSDYQIELIQSLDTLTPVAFKIPKRVLRDGNTFFDEIKTSVCQDSFSQTEITEDVTTGVSTVESFSQTEINEDVTTGVSTEDHCLQSAEVIVLIDAGVLSSERIKLEQAALQFVSPYKNQKIQVIYVGTSEDRIKNELTINKGSYLI